MPTNIVPKIKESDIQRAILEWLELNGHRAWRSYTGPIMHRQGRMSPNPIAGYPDITGFLCKNHCRCQHYCHMSKMCGKVFFCEVKTPKGKLSDRQIIWRDMIDQRGGAYILARSLQDFIEQFKGLEWFKKTDDK